MKSVCSNVMDPRPHMIPREQVAGFVKKVVVHKTPVEILSLELIFSLLVVAMCFYIFYKTREIHSLTKHEGIGYFRNVFLFFGLAYLLRTLYIFTIFFKDIFHVHLTRELIILPMLFVSYLSTMALLSLCAVIFIRVWRIPYLNIIKHVLAVGLVLFVFLNRSPEVMIAVHLLLMIVSITLLFSRPATSKFNYNRFTYLLLFLFWVISLFGSIRFFIPFYGKVLIYVFSLLVFGSVFYRVNKRLINGKEKRSS